MVVASVSLPEESDFSPRKLKIAAAIIVGTLFGSTVLPMMALGLLLLRRHEPRAVSGRELPRPMMPVITTDDPALCEADGVASVP